MGPVRSRDSARSKPRGKVHPGMADGEGGPPLSRTDSILLGGPEVTVGEMSVEAD